MATSPSTQHFKQASPFCSADFGCDRAVMRPPASYCIHCSSAGVAVALGRQVTSTDVVAAADIPPPTRNLKIGWPLPAAIPLALPRCSTRSHPGASLVEGPRLGSRSIARAPQLKVGDGDVEAAALTEA